jgi:hypothetical protein
MTVNRSDADLIVISKFFIYFVAGVVIICWTVLYLQGHGPRRKGDLVDTDCYMRLVRVTQLHESGEWYDATISRSNAPFGETLHWTRPLDVLLLAGARLVQPLAGFRNGLFWCAVFISPVLLAFSIVLVPWAMRPLLGADTARLASLLFVFQAGALSRYHIGNPGHHALLGFMSILGIGLILRILLERWNKKMCYLAGIAGAVELWIHVESQLLIFLNLALLGLFWVFDNDDDLKLKNLHYSLSLVLFSAAALVLERPWYDLGRIEYDKISLVHCCLLVLVSLFWIAVFALQHLRSFSRLGRTGRFAIAGLGALGVALFMWLTFPKFYRGGFVDVDPRIVPIWLSKVEESLSPLRRDFMMPLIQLIGSALTGVPFIAYVLWHRPTTHLKGWLFILAGIVLFVSACVFERRLLLYGNIMTLAPLAALLGMVLQWESRYLKRFHTIIRRFIRPLTITAFGAGFLWIGCAGQYMLDRDSPSKAAEGLVPLARMCDELNNLGGAGQARPLRILAHIDYGPEILYRTPCEVIATPYHRNAQGILDAYDIMTASSNDKAHALILRRKIDMILISEAPGELNFFSAPGRQTTFYQQLRRNASVDWLQSVALPQSLAPTYRLFRVVG